jgi:hypothetical protein
LASGLRRLENVQREEAKRYKKVSAEQAWPDNQTNPEDAQSERNSDGSECNRPEIRHDNADHRRQDQAEERLARCRWKFHGRVFATRESLSLARTRQPRLETSAAGDKE